MQYAIQLNSDANSLESVAAIKKVLEEAEKNFPPDMKIEIVQDNTEYVKESLKEVGVTFIETLLLVVLITWDLPPELAGHADSGPCHSGFPFGELLLPSISLALPSTP